MPAEQDHQLDALIRIVDVNTFSLTAHQPGFLLPYDGKINAVIHTPGFLDKLFGGKDRFTYYFVKQLEKPLAVKDWQFQWSDGASQIDLDFVGNFGIRVADKESGAQLVKALHRPEGPAKTLHKLIDKRLHETVAHLVRDCLANGSNLLERLLDPKQEGRQEVRVHPAINNAVADAISRDLGIHFVISFTSKNLPQRQLQIEKHTTEFSIPDLSDKRRIDTSVHLELDNYQNYMRANIKGDDAGMALIKQYIDDAVRSLIFGKMYFDIASNFESSIQPEIEKFVKDKAGTIGYKIKMFQTQPDIGVMCLARGFRIELSAAKHEFRPRLSTGFVKMDVALELTARDYKKVSHIIEPWMNRDQIRDFLEDKLAQICGDVIQRIERKHFNLEFDAPGHGLDGERRASVVDILTNEFKRVFESRHGMAVSVINISQAQTEEGERFTGIRGQATPFNLNITAQADGGMRDKVEIKGKFEVTDIVPDGWDRFQSKDFGYSKQSASWTAARRAALKKNVALHNPNFTDADYERERKAAALHDELAEIGLRISSVLENAISKITDVANRSREWQDIRSLWDMSEKMASKHILDEFGLVIVFREFHRTDTLSERTQSSLHEMRHAAIVERGAHDLLRSDAFAEQIHDGNLAYLEKLQHYKNDQLERDPNDEPGLSDDMIEEKIQAVAKQNNWQSIAPGSAVSVLEQKPSDKKNLPRLGGEFESTSGNA
jgi:hypothetical protein